MRQEVDGPVAGGAGRALLLIGHGQRSEGVDAGIAELDAGLGIETTPEEPLAEVLAEILFES